MKTLIKSLHRVLADDYSLYTDPSGKYWGNRGAGVIFRAKDTGRYLLAHRSKYVNEPNTWGVWGGKIDDESETPKQAAMREVREEAGFRDDRYSIKHLHQFKDGEFIFDTFLVEVDEEFEPKLDWETQDFGWFEKSKFPSNLHFGLKPLLPKLGTMATASADSATPKGDEFNLSKLRNHKLLTALHRVSAAKYSKIYHVGKLDSGKRAKPDQSLEGSGVSVSLNPNAWRKIARLSGDVYP